VKRITLLKLKKNNKKKIQGKETCLSLSKKKQTSLSEKRNMLARRTLNHRFIAVVHHFPSSLIPTFPSSLTQLEITFQIPNSTPNP
jgi:hypothetical protein